MFTAVDPDVIGRTAEVIVHRHHISRLQERPHDHILCGTALMRRHHITLAQHVKYCLLQPFEGLAAGVGIVGPHHGGQLQVAHGVGSAVGQHVQIDIGRIHAVGIESALLQGLVSLIYGKEPHLLDYPGPVKLQGYIYACVEFDFRHLFYNFFKI